ncbi:HlyD family type I secretion periplasmic adaptor subunit [Jannaschia sp. KMU-145]|uniref:HlyD family type I secretion periplasmic adaptor subunit n=1 Tax=Jannaschia halovivens TaxID=3388667 RepID=UPI00396B128A
MNIDKAPSGIATPRPAFDKLRGRIIMGAVLAVGLFGGVGGWAMTAKLTGAVISMGTVKVDEEIKQIQHRDGGIVSEILVREGDEIAAGDVMFRLDDAQSAAELSILLVQRDEAMARRARLLADRDGLEEIVFPDRFLTDPALAELVAGEVRLHRGNLQNRSNQRQQMEVGIVQIDEEIEGLHAQRGALEDELLLVEESHARLEDLVARGLMESPRLDASARDRVQLRGKLGELAANIARSRSRISEMEMRILAVDDLARTEAQRELAVVETRVSELRDRIVAVEDRLSRTDIRAPLSGRINELSVTTIGGVITPAEVLATIVPANADLKIEMRLPLTAIDQVYVDQAARVRFSSFNHRTTPELTAKVRYVSPATTVDPATGEPGYIGYVDLDAGEMEKLGDLKLMPGMPVEIYVATEEQTAANYLVKPITDQIARAFKEE